MSIQKEIRAKTSGLWIVLNKEQRSALRPLLNQEEEWGIVSRWTEDLARGRRVGLEAGRLLEERLDLRVSR